MTALLESDQASYSSKPSDRTSSGKAPVGKVNEQPLAQARAQASAMMLRLLSLHSALQAAAKQGTCASADTAADTAA